MCQAITKKGNPCKLKNLPSHIYCKRHYDVFKLKELEEQESVNIPACKLRRMTGTEIIIFNVDEVQYVVQLRDRHTQLLEAEDVLKNVVNRDTISTVLINTNHDNTSKLKDTHREQISKYERKLDDVKNRYAKIHTLYTESVAQIIDMKRRLKQSNQQVNALEQSKKYFIQTEDVKQCLMNYAILDEFIQGKIREGNGRIGRNKLLDFMSLGNVSDILDSLDTTADEFKTKFNLCRETRINYAHPQVLNVDTVTVRKILSHLV